MSGWKFRACKQFRLGPVYINFTQSGFSSWGIKLGPITKNMTRGSTTIDTPGPGSIRRGRRGGAR